MASLLGRDFGGAPSAYPGPVRRPTLQLPYTWATLHLGYPTPGLPCSYPTPMSALERCRVVRLNLRGTV